MSLDNVKRVCVNIAFVFVVLFGVCINLNARIMTLETSNSDLQQIIRTQKDELEKVKEKNTMQDVNINELNNDYNSRMAQQLQEVADENGIGG
uniref:Type-F conjugative transfer system protein n=1 Tax=Siphoviridae sp. ctjZA23 TaxID=2825633 RepID=A0A8S5PDP9_9CAUD|nr:MAG TPA: type-F conjugative transfer system protein [Siphoviridae sp. ctjZA23]